MRLVKPTAWHIPNFCNRKESVSKYTLIMLLDTHRNSNIFRKKSMEWKMLRQFYLKQLHTNKE